VNQTQRGAIADDMDGGDGYVVSDGDEFQQELALCAGLQAGDLANQRATFVRLREY